MAKLVTTKEKYGVSVAARIDPGMAHRISERAERLGVSMAKMVSLLIARGFNPHEPIVVENHEKIDRLESGVEELNLEISELHESHEELKTLYQTTAAKFIGEIATDSEEQMEFAETYNVILNQLNPT